MGNEISRGDFIRVGPGHPNRTGKDGMVVDTCSEGVVLIFGMDRHNLGQDTVCVGPELWALNELDLTSLEK